MSSCSGLFFLENLDQAVTLDSKGDLMPQSFEASRGIASQALGFETIE
jgi:hypothetical protein